MKIHQRKKRSKKWLMGSLGCFMRLSRNSRFYLSFLYPDNFLAPPFILRYITQFCFRFSRMLHVLRTCVLQFRSLLHSSLSASSSTMSISRPLRSENNNILAELSSHRREFFVFDMETISLFVLFFLPSASPCWVLGSFTWIGPHEISSDVVGAHRARIVHGMSSYVPRASC